MTGTPSPGTPEFLRAHNDRAALGLFITHGTLTRTRLGELTGLSKVTASQMVERLTTRGLIRTLGTDDDGKRGPKAKVYALDPRCAHVMAAELTPDGLAIACADITGAIVSRATVRFEEAPDPLATAHAAVEAAAKEAGLDVSAIDGIVIGTPGVIDPLTGEAGYTSDLPTWTGRLRAELRTASGKPVQLANDVNLAAVAEAQAGAAVGQPDFALFWIGRGVGLATVVGGRVLRGAHGAAGELGYLPVPGCEVPRNPARPEVRGGMQSLIGAEAVLRLAAEHGIEAGDAAEAVRSAVEKVAAAEPAAGAAGLPIEGSRSSGGRSFLDELGRRIALGVAACCAIMDPPLVVLAGPIGTTGGELLADIVHRETTAITLAGPDIVPTETTDAPVLQGALFLALDSTRKRLLDSIAE
ncbi:ROK family transcriptional regulator [Actinoplanes sp. NPDC049548]|uniref:ROK family transcriptional regulator n=1 Tax=Actinoplanes sp. NPDC049548 TaxID=3155152 RepID=UPI003439CDDF